MIVLLLDSRDRKKVVAAEQFRQVKSTQGRLDACNDSKPANCRRHGSRHMQSRVCRPRKILSTFIPSRS